MEESTPFQRLTWPARTERLLLRPLRADDVPAVFEIRRQPEVARWMSALPDDYEEFVQAFSDPARTDTMLVMLHDGALVGDLYLAVSDAWGQREVAAGTKRTQAEIGWCVDPAYAGRGLASEGAAELLRLCFDGLGLRRATAGAFAANAASIRVMEKIGMTIEGRGRQDSLHRELGWVDGVTAAVLADEWRAARWGIALTAGPPRRQGDRVTLDEITWPVRTARLAIRPATASDLPAIFAIRTLPEVGRWLPELPASYDEFAVRFGQLEMMPKTFVIDLEGVLIGDLYLHLLDAWSQVEVADRAGREAEIGWCLSPDHQGHGYATEAAGELMRLAFADLGVRRVTAAAFADNLPSLRIMERLGMRQESHGVKDSLHRDLGWIDGTTYAVRVDEWEPRATRG